MHSSLYVAVLLFAFSLSVVFGEPTYGDTGNGNGNAGVHRQNTLLAEANAQNTDDSGADASNYDKRVERYAFGLGRRAYTYANGGNGIKRLPVYNFGLGKRARPYSFGLGKRSEYEEDQYGDNEFDRLNAAYMDEKRNRPYSFGLGKRDVIDDVDRRGYPNRYGFGLGR